MRSRAGSILAIAALVAVPLAAQSNLGNAREGAIGAHVLTSPDGVGGAVDILYAPSEADDPAHRAAIAALTGGVVDYYDAAAGTPDPALLASYDCVYTWANFSYSDETTFGNNLATYVDGGGRVILGAFTTYDVGNSMGGAIRGAGYSPVSNPTGSNFFLTSSYAGDGTTFIHDNVTSYDCVFRDTVALQGSGAQDGSYLDGAIGHAYRPDFNVIFSNGVGAEPVAASCGGDWALLIANACAGGVYVPPIIQEVPALGGWGLAALMLALAAAAVLLVRRRSASV